LAADTPNFSRLLPPRHTNCAKHRFCFVKRWVTPFAKREMQPGQDREAPVTDSKNSPASQPATGLTGRAVSILRGSLIALGLGVIFAWLGVYGTTQIPIVERVIYWTGLMGLGISAAALVNPLIFDRLMKDSHPSLQIAAVALIISVPITIGLLVIEATEDGTFAQPAWWWTQYFYVVIVSALLTTGGWAIDRLNGAKAMARSANTAPGGEASLASVTSALAFADRLPPKFRAAEIHAVSAEDHYLRVHTSAGETMILMRLADAIRELGGLEGMQTHRSWWVARQGLAETAKGDGKVTLKLKSGAEAPVSRTYQKAVKDAGWL
jgi:hypothetical protein